jgi:ADP-heptose:LPS heptosyltransferase
MLWFGRKKEIEEPDGPEVLRLRPPAGYGDHLMFSAVLEGLKAEHPDRRILLAARAPDLFLHNPHVEEVLDENRLKKREPEKMARYRRISFRRPEARVMQTTGHLIDDLYAAVGLPLREQPRQPRIYLSPEEEAFRHEALDQMPRPLIAVSPFGRTDVLLPNKIYPAGQWTELGAHLAKRAGTLLQLGTRTEGPLLAGATDYRDIGYRNTGAVLKHCDLLVTHVGGLMHLAAAVRAPTLVLYGAAEHPEISGYPWNRNLYTEIECGPCWMRDPCSHHTCMRRLTPEVVMEEVEVLLAGQV